jgi:methionine biosynthesis protein MetW
MRAPPPAAIRRAPGRAAPRPAADRRHDRAGTRVLDIGCGDGALLAIWRARRSVDARGIELSQSGVNACVRHGLSVIQGDADSDLDAFPNDAFDVVVLSRTLQATRQPRHVLEALLRIGKRAIVSFPNFGFWRIRLGLLFHGQMPKSELLHNHWYDTPNIHLCTIRDFVMLCDEVGARVERSLTLDRHGRPFRARPARQPGQPLGRAGHVRAVGQARQAQRD